MNKYYMTDDRRYIVNGMEVNLRTFSKAIYQNERIAERRNKLTPPAVYVRPWNRIKMQEFAALIRRNDAKRGKGGNRLTQQQLYSYAARVPLSSLFPLHYPLPHSLADAIAKLNQT